MCDGCKYYRSEPLWNCCTLTQAEYFIEPIDCEYKRREGEDDASFDY